MKSSELERKVADRNTSVNGRGGVREEIHLEELKRIQKAATAGE